MGYWRINHRTILAFTFFFSLICLNISAMADEREPGLKANTVAPNEDKHEIKHTEYVDRAGKKVSEEIFYADGRKEHTYFDSQGLLVRREITPLSNSKLVVPAKTSRVTHYNVAALPAVIEAVVGETIIFVESKPEHNNHPYSSITADSLGEDPADILQWGSNSMLSQTWRAVPDGFSIIGAGFTVQNKGKTRVSVLTGNGKDYFTDVNVTK